MWRCQFSLLVCPSSYYFIYIFFLISSIVLFNMCRRSAPVASSYLLMYSLHVELILLGYDGEDMIVLGTSGGGDDLVCNVVIFLGRVDFFRAYRGFDVQFVGIYLPLWTSACIFVALTSILWLFLAPLGLPPCLPLPQSPIPTLLLYLDTLTSLIHKRIKAMPVYCYQHCSYLTYSILL